MMGSAFRLQGTVVSGSNLGSRIGFPTANFTYPSDSRAAEARRLRDAYACLDGVKDWPSITYVGCRSLRDGRRGDEMLVETHHITIMTADLYGRSDSPSNLERFHARRVRFLFDP
jgi:FAD synthase